MSDALQVKLELDEFSVSIKLLRSTKRNFVVGPVLTRSYSELR